MLMTCIYQRKTFLNGYIFSNATGLFSIMSIQSRRRTGVSDRSITPSPAASKVNHLYGVKAWKSWVQQRDKEQAQREPHSLSCPSVVSRSLTP